MGKIISFAVLGCAALALTACANLRDRTTDYICKHQVQVSAGARATIAAAPAIKDPKLRQAAIDGANLLLDQVAACPPAPAGSPTPPG